ncbi:MAG: glucosamine-6-phosphate deaminase [Paludibacteraceae bacterium]|nr:glucosamine-6-phosphate deaminase [Candidatus Physcocola equi]MCQ2233570.1 glucosamine-6-phosphate deaminase [Paludibacteraceae bacterium]
MRVIITKDYEDMSKWAANYVAQRIIDFKPTADRKFVLGCPTGSSPLGLYKQLIRIHKSGKLSFEHVVTFNMDEYVNLPEAHPESYHSFMWTNFFNHIDIKKENVHILNGNAPDLRAECENYERMIEEAGGIELFMGGIGPDGHIAFNEPGSSLSSKTRIKTLTTNTIQANCRFFNNDMNLVPKQALTVGVGTVMAAREVLIVCNGPQKSLALHHTIDEGVNHMWTASAMQLHPHGNIVCDESACVDLKLSTYQYFKDKQQLEGIVDEYLNKFE